MSCPECATFDKYFAGVFQKGDNASIITAYLAITKINRSCSRKTRREGLAESRAALAARLSLNLENRILGYSIYLHDEYTAVVYGINYST